MTRRPSTPADGVDAPVLDGPADEPPRDPGPAPVAAATVYGDHLPVAVRYAEILADTGVSHGLIGPREVPRLWDRHVLNCAVVEDAFPEGARVVDVGSGAGLPGLAIAVARPDLEIHLVEPMLRRTLWLSNTVSELELENVTVHRGRAEEFHGVLRAPWTTARAVARIDKLARWCFPLLEADGTLVALKGRSAGEELEEERRVLSRLGMVDDRSTEHGGEVLDEPTLTLDLTVGGRPATKPTGDRRRKR